MSEQKERLGLILFLDSLALILSTLATYMTINLINNQPLIGDLALVLVYYVGIKILILAIANVTGIGKSVLVAMFFVLLANGAVIVIELFMSLGVSRQLMFIIAVADLVLIGITHVFAKVTAPGYKESKERRKWLADQDQSEDRDHDQLLDNLVSAKTSGEQRPDPKIGETHEEGKVELEPLLLKSEEKTSMSATDETVEKISRDDKKTEEKPLEEINQAEIVIDSEVKEIPITVSSEKASSTRGEIETDESTEYFDHQLYDDLAVTDEILTDLITNELTKQSGLGGVMETDDTVQTKKEDVGGEEVQIISGTDQVMTDELVQTVVVDRSEDEVLRSKEEADWEIPVDKEKESEIEIKYHEGDTKPVDDISSVTKNHHLETNLDYMRRSSKQTEAEELLNAVHSFSKELDSLEVSYSDEELTKTGNNIREKLKMIVDKQYVLDEVMEDLTQLSKQINLRIDDLDRIESELKRRADAIQKREIALEEEMEKSEIDEVEVEEIPFILEPDEILVDWDGSTIIINREDYALLMKNTEI